MNQRKTAKLGHGKAAGEAQKSTVPIFTKEATKSCEGLCFFVSFFSGLHFSRQDWHFYLSFSSISGQFWTFFHSVNDVSQLPKASTCERIISHHKLRSQGVGFVVELMFRNSDLMHFSDFLVQLIFLSCTTQGNHLPFFLRSHSIFAFLSRPGKIFSVQ